ncbi:MAG: Redox-sensing transcriptional repressor Rex [Planctomycetota bacterium]|jgi:redox-sensing transcriptional repressor
MPTDLPKNQPDDPNPQLVPVASANRLGIYLRELERLEKNKISTINSRQLGDNLGLSDSQIRRDLAIFGQFGRRGVGYSVRELAQSIREILGINQDWGVILIGVGNLGRALAGYRGFAKNGYRLIAAFDNNPAVVGSKLAEARVHHIDSLEKVIPTLNVQLAILAVPADSAQALAIRLSKCGIQGILNFAPVTLKTVQQDVTCVDVDLALELQRLVFAVVSRDRTR